MTWPVVLRKAAQTEFDRSIDWYEQRRLGLGIDFLQCVNESIRRIAETPEMHPLIYKDIRRAPVRKFPFSLLYRIKADRIVVISVFHNKRNPRIWQGRA